MGWYRCPLSDSTATLYQKQSESECFGLQGAALWLRTANQKANFCPAPLFYTTGCGFMQIHFTCIGLPIIATLMKYATPPDPDGQDRYIFNRGNPPYKNLSPNTSPSFILSLGRSLQKLLSLFSS